MVDWSVAAILDISYLVSCDHAADYRMLPIIIRANQCAGTVVQLQGGISQCIGNIIWRCTELRTYGTNNHLLCARSLNDKAANHYVVTSLHKAASADIAKNGSSVSAKIVHFHRPTPTVLFTPLTIAV